jgi:hypothetical protein
VVRQIEIVFRYSYALKAEHVARMERGGGSKKEEKDENGRLHNPVGMPHAHCPTGPVSGPKGSKPKHEHRLYGTISPSLSL